MNKGTRFFILLITVLVSLWFIYPTIQWYFMMPQQDRDLLKYSETQMDGLDVSNKIKYQQVKAIRKQSLKLGLDLMGGVQMIAEVNRESFSNQLLESALLTSGGTNTNKDLGFEKAYKEATENAIVILRNRMDEFGVAEPDIRITYSDRIAIELPGMNNPAQIREALSKAGKLEFHLVDEEAMKQLQTMNVPISNGILADKTLPEGFELSEDSDFYPYFENDSWGIPKKKGYYILKKEIKLDGQMMKTARPGNDSIGNPIVDFELKPEGADIFSEVTEENVGTRLAIVLDGKVRTAPNISGKIPFGRGEITGRFTFEEVALLCNVLKSGALDVGLTILEERSIGPSLGQQAITDGASAAMWGTLIVIVFMVIYYRASGMISIVALGFNILFLIGLLAMRQATLTLPGIAGVALTIGMAVDANVLIYERVREELRRSRSYKHALDNGFLHASATIWDSNLTTLMASFALSAFGTGSIQGFGLTLTFGILANIFAALFVSRLMFDWLLDTFKFKKISV